MKVAIVTDALFVYSGAERVIEQLLAIYKDADVFALVDFLEPSDRSFLGGRSVATTFVQRLPLAKRNFRNFLNLWPIAIEQLDLRPYDLVISSHNAVAHGVLTGPSQLHVAFTHSPMRYAWDLQAEYLAGASLDGLKGAWARSALHKLRVWDLAAGQRPDHFVANSRFVASRIEKYYRRKASVVYPPVYVHSFEVGENKEEFYVTSGRLVSYKRVDLIAAAFEKLRKKIIIIGDGPEYKKLSKYSSEYVTFLGRVPHARLNQLLGQAKAFVFAGIEDFGIAPLEAQATGTPVIAFNGGGLCETIQGLNHNSPTGLFFEHQSVDSLCDSIRFFESQDIFDPAACRLNATRFSPAAFRDKFDGLVQSYQAAGMRRDITGGLDTDPCQTSQMPIEVQASGTLAWSQVEA